MIKRINWLRGSVAAVAFAAVLASCVDAAAPLPAMEGDILAFEIEGQIAGSTVINEQTYTVEVALPEAVDIERAVIARLELTEGGVLELSDGTVVGEGSAIDLSEALPVIVRTRSGHDWTIRASQNIEYRFVVDGWIRGDEEAEEELGEDLDRAVGQIGESIFDITSNPHCVYAYVPRGTDMTAINIKALKLAPELGEGVEVTYNPSLNTLLTEPQSFRLTGGAEKLHEIEVWYRNVTERWHLHVIESDVQVSNIDPFARRAYITGYGAEGAESRFEYRLAEGYDPATDTGWEPVPESMMTDSGRGGVFTATLRGLEPETEYLIRAISDGNISDVREFTTGKTKVLPQASFNEWSWGKDPRKAADNALKGVESWSPWPADGIWRDNRWWDTGNKGVAFVDREGGGNSLATEPGEGCPDDPNGRAAKLQTRYAMVKAAGGNIYFGEFGEMYGINATCRLGHNWSDAKPTKLRGWYKYYPHPIDEANQDHVDLHPYRYPREKWIGSPDSLHVCVALWADPSGQDLPFEVDTRTEERGKYFLDFSTHYPKCKNGLIAYGAFKSQDRQDSWAKFEIEIEYLPKYFRDYSEKTGGKLPPNTQLYLLITASKNCNYFIAGTGTQGTKDKSDDKPGSLMYVDELELVYD